MTGDTLEAIQRDFLHGIAQVVDALNRLTALYAPATPMREIAMQVRAEIVEDAPQGLGEQR